MRVLRTALVCLMLVGCAEQPQGPVDDGIQESVSAGTAAPSTIDVPTVVEKAKRQRAQEIAAMISRAVGQAGDMYEAGCYPPRQKVPYRVLTVSQIAEQAVQMEDDGWEIRCVAFAGEGDSYGAVHPDLGVLFECPVAEGLALTMLRGSVEDGTAECAVLQ
jgi:hypothetical protein